MDVFDVVTIPIVLIDLSRLLQIEIEKHKGEGDCPEIRVWHASIRTHVFDFWIDFIHPHRFTRENFKGSGDRVHVYQR